MLLCSNRAPSMATQPDNARTQDNTTSHRVGRRLACCSLTAIASEAGSEAPRKKLGPHAHPPYHAHHLAYTSTRPPRKISQSRWHWITTGETPVSSRPVGTTRPG